LLRCGVCGGSMTVVGRKAKAGVSYARLGCTAHSSRGSAICANALSISERKASAALIDALRSKFGRPELVERFIASFQERVAERQREAAQIPTAAGAIEDCERRIANLTEALAKVGWSDALAGKLRDEELTLTQLRAKRTAELKERAPRPLPTPAAIASYLDDLLGVLQTDTVRGRELLSRFVSPVIMTPETESPVRRYRATGAFNLSFLLTAAASGESGSGKSGCAGRI
jgi:site-specific DNA recombinase